MSNALEISDVNFDSEVKRATVPVLVDFFAPWCGPCRMQGPVLDELAAEYGDKARIVKINVDANQLKANEYNVSGIPALILFVDGQAKEQFVGFQKKPDLKRAIDKYVG